MGYIRTHTVEVTTFERKKQNHFYIFSSTKVNCKVKTKRFLYSKPTCMQVAVIEVSLLYSNVKRTVTQY